MDIGDAVGEEADDVYNQILGEIGMDVAVGATTGTGAIASNKQPVPKIAEEQKDDQLDDLEARMAALGGIWTTQIKYDINLDNKNF